MKIAVDHGDFKPLGTVFIERIFASRQKRAFIRRVRRRGEKDPLHLRFAADRLGKLRHGTGIVVLRRKLFELPFYAPFPLFAFISERIILSRREIRIFIAENIR